METKDLPKCECGIAYGGLLIREGRAWCSGCLWKKIERLQAINQAAIRLLEQSSRLNYSVNRDEGAFLWHLDGDFVGSTSDLIAAEAAGGPDVPNEIRVE